MDQVERIGDFPEPDQRSSIREPGESAGIAHAKRTSAANSETISRRARRHASILAWPQGPRNGQVAVQPEPMPVIAEREVQQRANQKFRHAPYQRDRAVPLV